MSHPQTTPGPTPTDPALTRPEAARYLGISPATLDRERAKGNITPVVISRRVVRYRVSELERFLDRGQA